MTYRLSSECIRRSIDHLCRYGDTDVFPHLPEIAFLREQKTEITAELENLDLDVYVPSSAFEALGPKSRYGFRIVHQLPLIDTTLLLAAVIEIGQLIERFRLPQEGIGAFSYRFSLDDQDGIFRKDRTYRDWMQKQLDFVQEHDEIVKVVSTDICDFYSRVNFHRLENLLDEAAPSHGAVRYIKRHIKAIRAKQSFGLPVGGNAARLLAELALTDTDHALEAEGRLVTRFVDDFRIFLHAGEDPYDALSSLAEHLGLSDGLSLNVAKTKVEFRKPFIEKLEEQFANIADKAEGEALEALTSELYFDHELNLEELDKLKSMNLIGFLQDEAEKESFDMGRIKVIFRALRIAKPFESIEYISNNFRKLVVFSKELVLLMQEVEAEHKDCFDNMSEIVIDCILPPQPQAFS